MIDSITNTDVIILKFLSDNKDKVISIADISRFTGNIYLTILAHINALNDNDLIHLTNHDNRQYDVNITQKGEELLELLK